MTAPAAAYLQRAGNAPKPDGYAELTDEHAHDLDAAVAWALGVHPLSAAPRIFWADISEFQSPVTAAYPWQQLAIRLDTGWRLDNNAQANHTKWPKLHRTGFLMGYVVFIPGESKAIQRRITNAFGAHLEGLAPMVDMESGRGFAGPGNHSAEANDFVADLAARTGDRAREVGYANGGDWSNNWPSRPKWLKRIVANYSSTVLSGVWAQQYHGGGDWPVPYGWPRSVKPWGSYIDLNSAALTVPGARQALGLEAPTPPKPTPTPTPTPTPEPTPVPTPFSTGRRPSMLICRVEKTTVPKGKTWPGWFTFDGSHVAHITGEVDKVNNGANLLAANGQKAVCEVTYAQWQAWGGK